MRGHPVKNLVIPVMLITAVRNSGDRGLVPGLNMQASSDWSNPKTWFSNPAYELLRPVFGQSIAELRGFLSESWDSRRLTVVSS